jgi:hypothetical protein
MDDFTLTHIIIGMLLAVILAIVVTHRHICRKKQSLPVPVNASGAPVIAGGIITVATLIHVFLGIAVTGILSIIAMHNVIAGMVIAIIVVLIVLAAYARRKSGGPA